MALLLLAGPRARARGAPAGGEGGRRHRLAAVLARDGAADEAGDPRRTALPHAGRVPDLRQHLHPDPGRLRTPARSRSSNYDQLFTALNLGVGLRDVGPDLHPVGIIAFAYIKGFGAAAPGQEVRRDEHAPHDRRSRLGRRQRDRRPVARDSRSCGSSRSRSRIPSTITDGSFYPARLDAAELPRHLRHSRCSPTRS